MSEMSREKGAGVPLLWSDWSEAGLSRLLWRYARLNHRELAEVDMLEAWPTAQQEAIASEWSRRLFYRLLVPVLSGVIVRGCMVPLPLAKLQLNLAPDLTTQGVVLPEGGLSLADGWPGVGNKQAAAFALQRFMQQTLQPLIALMARIACCRERLLWCSFACCWQWWLQTPELEEAVASLALDERALALDRLHVAMLFTEQASLPCAGCEPEEPSPRNPLFQPMRWRLKEGKQVPVRKVCCQRYQIPGLPLCSYCPHVFSPPRGQREEQPEQEKPDHDKA